MSNYLPAFAVLLLYAGASLLLLSKLRQPITGDTTAFRDKRPALWLAGIAVLLHGLITFQRSGLPEALSLPFFTAFSATMVAIVSVQLVMCISRPADYLGLAIYPIAGIGLISSELFQSQAKALSQSLQLHVLLSIMAYAVLALCAAQAVLVAVQRRYLNKHKPGGFILVHKTVLACVAWVIFAVLLFGRWRFGWRGQRVVRWTLAGFATLLVGYFGSKLVLELILQR